MVQTVGGVGAVAPGQSYSEGSSSNSSTPGVIPGMQDIYTHLLDLNKTNYGNVMDAYQGRRDANTTALPGVYQDYNTLSGDVANTLGMGQQGGWGVATPAANAIARQQAQTSGDITQQMTSAGLGNTTAAAQAQQQGAYNTNLAYGNLGAQLADKYAGYQSNIGLAREGAQMQGLGMQSSLTASALGPLGQQFANTAGQLVGNTSSGASSNFSNSQAYPPVAPINLNNTNSDVVSGLPGEQGVGTTTPAQPVNNNNSAYNQTVTNTIDYGGAAAGKGQGQGTGAQSAGVDKSGGGGSGSAGSSKSGSDSAADMAGQGKSGDGSDAGQSKGAPYDPQKAYDPSNGTFTTADGKQYQQNADGSFNLPPGTPTPNGWWVTLYDSDNKKVAHPPSGGSPQSNPPNYPGGSPLPVR